MRKKKDALHREGLIALYENQLTEESSKFMEIVLIEAVRKLKESDIKPIKIEGWVISLEKLWQKFKF